MKSRLEIGAPVGARVSRPQKSTTDERQRFLPQRQRVACCRARDGRAPACPNGRCESRPHSRAFTRIELVVILLVVALAVALIFSLVNTRDRYVQPMQCRDNLRQCVLAYHQWVSDHNGRFLPTCIYFEEGGAYRAPLAGNAWWQYSFLSNYLVGPKILVCPADKFAKRKAIRWDDSPEGGFLHPNYRGNAISYALNLDAHGKGAPEGPSDTNWNMLLSDRNFTASRYNDGCSALRSGVKVAAAVLRNGSPSAIVWTNAVHGLVGNTAMFDGSVHQLNSQVLFGCIIRSDDNGAVHFLLPETSK
jgi:hypothetical protein